MTDYLRQIVVLGGGGFSMEPDEPALDLYVLEQARLPRPAVCFLATATGDSSRTIMNFYTSFSRYDCRPTHLPFFQRTLDVRAVLLSQDVIYVGGGNTRSMLAVWREWGLPQILREAWEAGILLAGISAGAICWFERGLSDSAAGELSVIEGLGFLKGSCCPHYDEEVERRPTLHAFLREGRLSGGLAYMMGPRCTLWGIGFSESLPRGETPALMRYGFTTIKSLKNHILSSSSGMILARRDKLTRKTPPSYFPLAIRLTLHFCQKM